MRNHGCPLTIPPPGAWFGWPFGYLAFRIVMITPSEISHAMCAETPASFALRAMVAVSTRMNWPVMTFGSFSCAMAKLRPFSRVVQSRNREPKPTSVAPT